MQFPRLSRGVVGKSCPISISYRHPCRPARGVKIVVAGGQCPFGTREARQSRFDGFPQRWNQMFQSDTNAAAEADVVGAINRVGDAERSHQGKHRWLITCEFRHGG